MRSIVIATLMIATTSCTTINTGSIPNSPQKKTDVYLVEGNPNEPLMLTRSTNIAHIQEHEMVDSIIDKENYLTPPDRDIGQYDKCNINTTNGCKYNYKNKVLIFIHGFRNTNNDAVKIAAHIKHRMQFNGDVIAYSWPSKNLLLFYTGDSDTAYWASFNLRLFLDLLFINNDKNTEYFIISHSMGGKITIGALTQSVIWRGDENIRDKVRIIFADPDIGINAYREFELLTSKKQRPILYVSYDIALRAASSVYWGEERAGNAMAWNSLINENHANHINKHSDVIGINVDLYEHIKTLGHNYFYNDIFLDDINDVISGKSIYDRCMRNRIKNDVIRGIPIVWLNTHITKDSVTLRNNNTDITQIDNDIKDKCIIHFPIKP